MITDKQLHEIMPNCSAAKRSDYLPFIQQAMEEFEIDKYLRKAAFLSQLAHESAELRYMEEIADGSAYEGRRNLGNTQPGDGKRYKGRGPIQLTGRANYKKYGDLLGLDLINNPKMAATKEVGFRIAGLYWKLNGLNELADKGEQLVTAKIRGVNKKIPAYDYITYKINGGFNGKADRRAYYSRALRALKSGEAEDASETAVIEPETLAEPTVLTEEDKAKGVTTSVKPAEETEGTPPPAPAVEIKASQPSWQSRIASLSLPPALVGILAAIGKFLANIPSWAWAIIIPSAILGGIWMYNQSQERAQRRTDKLMDAGADKDKNNLRLI